MKGQKCRTGCDTPYLLILNLTASLESSSGCQEYELQTLLPLVSPCAQPWLLGKKGIAQVNSLDGSEKGAEHWKAFLPSVLAERNGGVCGQVK